MVKYNIYKDGQLYLGNVTAKKISELTGYTEKYIIGRVNSHGGYCKNLYIEKARCSLTKYEILDFEWDREIESIKALFKKAYIKRNIVTASARSYR